MNSKRTFDLLGFIKRFTVNYYEANCWNKKNFKREAVFNLVRRSLSFNLLRKWEEMLSVVFAMLKNWL